MAFQLDFEKPIIDLEEQIERLKSMAANRQLDVESEITPLKAKLAELQREIYDGLTPIQRVQVARHPKRPYTLDYIELIFTDFIVQTASR